MEDVIRQIATKSRIRLDEGLLKFPYKHIFAKINPIEPKPLESSVVFVITRDSLPRIPTGHEDNIAFRNYPSVLDIHLRTRNQKTHPQSVINMCELVKSELIYSGIDPVTKELGYWYQVQSNDILSRYQAKYEPAIHGSPENAKNDDVSRGYIVLLDDDMKRYNFTRLESCPSTGGKSSSLVKRKKRKNITKKRRKSRISRRKH